MFKLPISIKHTGFSTEDTKKLEVAFDNANRKFFDILHQRMGSAAKNFKIYIDNVTLVPEAIVLSSVAKATDPTTTTYTAGQTFDKTGLTATATYSNSATKTITATGLVAPTTALVAGQTSVTISYTELGVTKTFTVAITVS